jgi:hypothetical protein
VATPSSPLFTALARFRSSWPQRGWSYDNRVECVASSFSLVSAPSARDLINDLLPHTWNSRTLPAAPPSFRLIAERTGGVRASQLIFGADPVGRLIPYGLWWPWEEGGTISLRIGLEGASMAENIELCEAFGAEI